MAIYLVYCNNKENGRDIKNCLKYPVLKTDDDFSYILDKVNRLDSGEVTLDFRKLDNSKDMDAKILGRFEKILFNQGRFWSHMIMPSEEELIKCYSDNSN